jgi:hypothetical protein
MDFFGADSNNPVAVPIFGRSNGVLFVVLSVLFVLENVLWMRRMKKKKAELR